MIIIGITGTLGAGKGTVVEYLVSEKGFAHYSVRKFLTEKLEQSHLPVNRDMMVKMANELRTQNSPAYIVEQLFEQAKQSGKNCIIESIRNAGEIESLRKKENFILLSVDADIGKRFERITERGSSTDQIDFETFAENEKREMQSADPNAQNLSACMKLADIKIINNGTIEELFHQTEDALNGIEN